MNNFDLKKEDIISILETMNSPALLLDKENKIVFKNLTAKKMTEGTFKELLKKILDEKKETGRIELNIKGQPTDFDFKVIKLHSLKFISFSEEKKSIDDISKKLKENYNELEELNEKLFTAEESVKQHIEEINKKNNDIQKIEEKYRVLSESTTDMIFIVDKMLNIKYVNTSAANALKSTKENIMGKVLKEMFPFDDYKQKSGAIEKVINEKKPIYFESITFLPEGEVWLGTSFIPLINSNGEVDSIIGILKDISDRKRMEFDNLLLNERFGKVFKQNPLGIMISRSNDGKIIDVNDSCETLFGYSTDELLRKSTMNLYCEPGEWAFFTDKLLREGPQKNCELKIKRKNKEIRTVLISADHLEINEERCILSMIQDVTEETIANNTREVLFDISDAAFKTKDLSSLYPKIHKSLNKVLNAVNFYIAIYDKATDIINFPYFYDEKDKYASSKKFGNGLTEYALKKNIPLLLSGKEIKKMAEEKIIDLIGTLPVQWMGAPIFGETFIGLIAVQHYDENYKYTVNDKNILYFVSKQISRVFENKIKEKLLIQSEKKHRLLLDSIKFPILSLKEDMEIYYCNQAYSLFVEKNIRDLEGKNLIDVFPEFEKTKSFEAFKKCIKTGENQEVKDKIPEQNLTIRAKISRTDWGILSIVEYINENK